MTLLNKLFISTLIPSQPTLYRAYRNPKTEVVVSRSDGIIPPSSYKTAHVLFNLHKSLPDLLSCFLGRLLVPSLLRSSLTFSSFIHSFTPDSYHAVFTLRCVYRDRLLARHFWGTIMWFERLGLLYL